MADRKTGYQKIKGCCERAAEHDIEWVWVDTCCIDKSSSAELSEAINSMYRWYEGATVCYAYLADIDANTSALLQSTYIISSRWFTRGWTLQELIAPSVVKFYDAQWAELGTKWSLAPLLARGTRIPA